MCFRSVHVFTRIHLSLLQPVCLSVQCIRFLPVYTYTCTCILHDRRVHIYVCTGWYASSGNRSYSLCVAHVFMAQGALSCAPDWERVWVVMGLGARAHTLLPTVWRFGNQSTPRGAWPFCLYSGKVFQGLGVAAQSGRPERARPSVHYDSAAAARRQRSPVGGKVALTATQSGATPKRCAVFRGYADWNRCK